MTNGKDKVGYCNGELTFNIGLSYSVARKTQDESNKLEVGT